MTRSHVARTANLLGALGLAITDEMDRTSEATVLVSLDEFANGWSLQDVRQVLGLTHSGGVRLIDRLAADGLVERRPGASGREVSVRLTPAGRRAAARVRAARAATLAGVLDGITNQERDELTLIVEKLLGNITTRRLAERSTGDPPSNGWLCRLCDLDACGRTAGRCPVAATASGSGREGYGT